MIVQRVPESNVLFVYKVGFVLLTLIEYRRAELLGTEFNR